MTIYASINTKGGVGKTTIAVHLATYLAYDDSTLLIDGDAQRSTAAWATWRRQEHASRPSPTTTALLGRAIRDEGRTLAARFANTVIDAGGRDGESIRAALLLANEAIIPIGASQLDAAAITDALTLVDMARDYNPDLCVRILLNRIDSRTRDTADMLAFLTAQDAQIMSAMVAERVAYRRAIADGGTVHEYARDRAAMAEMDLLMAEVRREK